MPISASPAHQYLHLLREFQGPDELPWIDYFQLCMCCHFATAATFVPTDVDSKIRGILWREMKDRESLRSMADFALGSVAWDLAVVSKRITNVPGFGPISGHDGERLSVLGGAHGWFLTLGDVEYAEKTGAALDAELQREADAFRARLKVPGAELDVLSLATSLTHNCGDMDQAISFWNKGETHRASRARFGRLAHENKVPYQGMFQLAAQLYKETTATEGHRNYPLRGVRALRNSPELLLPLGPFLDEWGATVAKHPLLTRQDRAEVLEALVLGCRKIENQQGYFRALAGFQSADSKAFETAAEDVPTAVRRDLRAFRKQIDVPRVSFESMMRKKVVTLRNSLK